MSGALANDFTGGTGQITFTDKNVNVAISALSGTTTPGTVLTLTNEGINDYKLKFGTGFTDISWAASVGSTSTYTYYGKFTTAGYSLGGESLPAGVTVTDKNVSLGANALASVNVAISNSYSAAGYSGVGTSNLTCHIATRNELLSGFSKVPFSDASNVNQTAGEV